MNTAEAAAYLGVSIDWLRRDEGKQVPWHSLGTRGDRRYYVDEIDEWLRSRPKRREDPKGGKP